MKNSLQGTEEWFESRRGKITASKFGCLMVKGKGPYGLGSAAITYAKDIAAEILTGKRKEGIKNSATEHGIDSEAKAIKAYELKTFNKVQSVGFIEYNESVGGSPDGLIGNDGGVEVKCPFNPAVHMQTVLSKECHSKDYYWQIVGSMLVTGRKWWDYVSYCEAYEKNKLCIIRFERDEKQIELLKNKLEVVAKYVNELVAEFNESK